MFDFGFIVLIGAPKSYAISDLSPSHAELVSLSLSKTLPQHIPRRHAERVSLSLSKTLPQHTPRRHAELVSAPHRTGIRYASCLLILDSCLLILTPEKVL
jgi:hypothetical protein